MRARTAGIRREERREELKGDGEESVIGIASGEVAVQRAPRCIADKDEERGCGGAVHRCDGEEGEEAQGRPGMGGGARQAFVHGGGGAA